MNGLTDQQLLRDYTGRRSEAAFAELVRRHVDLIYSAAPKSPSMSLFSSWNCYLSLVSGIHL